MKRRLPAEWEKQAAVMLAWPAHAEIWEPELMLQAVQSVHLRIMRIVAMHLPVLVVAPSAEDARQAAIADGVNLRDITFCQAPTNDIWIRDYGPITVMEDGHPLLLDFGYNGWGLKYRADNDNQVTRRLHESGTFGTCPLQRQGIILEGGSIDSDGQGTLLTTTTCLLSPNRNPHLTEAEMEAKLRNAFGCERVIWLREGWLAGDDTDAHVDMLARFAPNRTILYTSCTDPHDEHYEPLARMERELRQLDGYTLRPLPIPRPIYGSDGRRLPASYANFLALPHAVLVPLYGDEEADSAAIRTFQEVFTCTIAGIDCRALIHQNGSLHCATMQLPAGVLPPST